MKHAVPQKVVLDAKLTVKHQEPVLEYSPKILYCTQGFSSVLLHNTQSTPPPPYKGGWLTFLYEIIFMKNYKTIHFFSFS